MRKDKILIVEDEKNIRESSKIALKRYGYSVSTAKNANEAIRIFEEKNGNFDILVSDIILPDKNGIDLAEELSLKNPNLTILLSSGHIKSKSQWQDIIGKDFPILQKPFSLNELLCFIKENA